MKMYDFKFVADNGTITYICAERRSEAIKLYSEQTGMPEDFIKKHCRIENLGLIKY